MKIDLSTASQASQELDEKMFSIGDPHMIFDVLRSKMYSNPVLAICREYACNARDSHREAGVPDLPIHIYLPNHQEPYFKVKDFGVGISPDRIENVFIKYGVSTKREDNTQTGSFGLGAKCAFSMSDSFSIVTNYNGVRYNYSCFIDETRAGKLLLLSETPTKESNGTEIIVPVKTQHFGAFHQYVEQVCRHWTVKPIIKGNNIEFKQLKYILQGKNWAISNNYSNAVVIVIMDGIEYQLETSVIVDDKFPNHDFIIDSCRSGFVLYFDVDVGELSLSANREQLYLDDKTQNVIRQRFEDVRDEIKHNLASKIENMSNLWEASCFYHTELKHIFNDLQLFGIVAWHGKKMLNNPTYLDCSIYCFRKRTSYYRRSKNPDKIYRSKGSKLSFEEMSELYINDLFLKDITPSHVKKAFDNNPALQSIQVLCPSEDCTKDDLEQDINLSALEPKKLSSLTNSRGRTRMSTGARVITYKLDDNDFHQCTYSTFEEDANTKVLCLLERNAYNRGRSVILEQKHRLQGTLLASLCNRYPDVSFYAIMCDTPAERISEDFGNLTTIDDFLENTVFTDPSTDFVAIKYADTCSFNFDERLLSHFEQFKKDIARNDSLFMRRLEAHHAVKNWVKSNHPSGNLFMLNLFEICRGSISDEQVKQYQADHPEHNLDVFDEKCRMQYPLIQHLSSYTIAHIVEHVIEYINMVDAKNT